MKFSEAVIMLESGNKITREKYKEECYFFKDDNFVNSYVKRFEIFVLNNEIIISDDWRINTCAPETSYKFYEIIDNLAKGYRAWKGHWENDYIYFDGQSLIKCHYEVLSTTICTEDLFAKDWIEWE